MEYAARYGRREDERLSRSAGGHELDVMKARLRYLEARLDELPRWGQRSEKRAVKTEIDDLRQQITEADHDRAEYAVLED